MNTSYKHIQKWARASNYGGSNFYEYYVGFGQSRDSEVLEQSNFQVALERLGGESETVIVERSGHWACGWVECILVHESDLKACTLLDEMKEEYDNYPVLDESDFSEREYEQNSDYAEQSKDRLAEALSVHFGLKNGKALKALAYDLNMECQMYYGNDSCVDIYDMRAPELRDIERLKECLNQVGYNCRNNNPRTYKALVKAVNAYLVPMKLVASAL